MSKKQEDWDDGRTVAPMTGEEIPQSSRGFFTGRERKKNFKKQEQVELTRKEKRAMMRAMFATMFPRFLIILASFSIVFLLLYLWLT